LSRAALSDPLKKSAGLIEEIEQLRQKRGALILAHHYQRPEVQEIADHVGDSLELSVLAAKTKKRVIVFCGVRFMAETAALLSPKKTVLLPVREAGCALADTVRVQDVRLLRKKYPNAVFVAYINTPAEVKAECDVCCTSANAARVVGRIPKSRPVVFLPDQNLGRYAASVVGRKVVLCEGSCPTHACISPLDIERGRNKHVGAVVMAHPECRPAVLRLADFVGGTAAMLSRAKEGKAGATFIVGTDIGLLYGLKNENWWKNFYPANNYLACPTMKLTTLEDVARSLKKMEHVVKVDEPTRSKAAAAIKKMF